MSTFPEHDKLRAVSDKSQTCGEFLLWLLERYTLGEYHAHDDSCHTEKRTNTCGMTTDECYPTVVNVRKLLAQFFEIDEDKLEEEKLRMLEQQRALIVSGKA